MKDKKKILEAVKNWIRAEYQFRLGGAPYTAETQDWLIKAERKLRRAITGKGNLIGAFEFVGGHEKRKAKKNGRGKRIKFRRAAG